MTRNSTSSSGWEYLVMWRGLGFESSVFKLQDVVIIYMVQVLFWKYVQCGMSWKHH